LICQAIREIAEIFDRQRYETSFSIPRSLEKLPYRELSKAQIREGV
jgi:hypothetical protein